MLTRAIPDDDHTSSHFVPEVSTALLPFTMQHEYLFDHR